MSENLKNKKWSGDQTVKFLEHYEQLPCLWDVNSNLYKNKEARLAAYETLCQGMGIEGYSIKDVKLKIRSIRNAYTFELNKIAKSKRTTMEDVYQPKVAWFPVADRILHNIVQTRETEFMKTDDWEDESESIFYPQPTVSWRSAKSPASLESNDTPKPSKRSKLDDPRQSYPFFEPSLLDKSQAFANHVAAKHREYSQRTQAYVEHYINNILFEADLGKFELESTPLSSNSDRL